MCTDSIHGVTRDFSIDFGPQSFEVTDGKTATNRFRVLDVRWLQRQQYLDLADPITQYFSDRRIGPAVVGSMS